MSPDTTKDETFDELWPESLLRHVVKAPSQYDQSCRAMAGEILRLRVTLATAQQERETMRAMLDNLTRDIREAMGERYQRIVNDAQGDISVNTAFKVAISDEREAAEAALADRDARLRTLEQQMRGQTALGAYSVVTLTKRHINMWADTISALLRHEGEQRSIDSPYTADYTMDQVERDLATLLRQGTKKPKS